jgi:hypothetical protein
LEKTEMLSPVYHWAPDNTGWCFHGPSDMSPATGHPRLLVAVPSKALMRWRWTFAPPFCNAYHGAHARDFRRPCSSLTTNGSRTSCLFQTAISTLSNLFEMYK